MTLVAIRLAVVLTVFGALQTQAAHPWPMYAHDSAHTGLSPSNGPTSANLLWSYNFGIPPSANTGPAVAADGTIYASVLFGLFAINPDGTLKWKKWDGLGSMHTTPAIAADGTVYAAVNIWPNEGLYALNPLNGAVVWSVPMRTSYGSPTVAADGTIYIASSDTTNYLYAIAPDGTVKWQWNSNYADCGFEDSVAVGANGHVHVSHNCLGLLTFNSTGSNLWANDTGGEVGQAFDTASVGPDGTIYLGASDYKFWAFNADGSTKWTAPVSKWMYMASASISADGSRIYRGDNGGTFYCFSNTGSIIWQYNSGNNASIFCAPALSANNVVYFTEGSSSDSPSNAVFKLYALRASDGVVLWTYPIGSSSSSPAIGADGTLYVYGSDNTGSGNAVLYAFAANGSTNTAPIIATVSPLPGGTVGQAYSAQLIGAGGKSPYTWSLTSGSLPPGLSLNVNTGVISGSPTFANSYNFTVGMKEAGGGLVSKPFSLTITTVTTGTLAITSGSPLPSGTINSPYSVTLQASGGTPPYSWSVTSGTMPTGLNLDGSTGVISGNPTLADTYFFTLSVTAAGSGPASKSFSLTINPVPSSSLTITTPSPLPSGMVGLPYTTSLQATGGRLPYEWSVTWGSLPPGLSLERSTGVISGTPTGTGTFSCNLMVNDAATIGSQGYYILTIAPNPSSFPIVAAPPAVTNSLLDSGNGAVVVAGQTNTFTVLAVDTNANPLNYQWTFGDGTTNVWSSLPTAIHVYAATNCGSYTATVAVSDGFTTVNTNVTVAVACPLQISKPTGKLSATINFDKLNADTCILTASLDLGTNFNPNGQTLTPIIGGVQMPFTLDKNGRGLNGSSTCRCSYNKSARVKAGTWTLTVTLSKNTWRTQWGKYGLDNASYKSPGKIVTMPVVIFIGNEAFAAGQQLHYTATLNKTGTAK